MTPKPNPTGRPGSKGNGPNADPTGSTGQPGTPNTGNTGNTDSGSGGGESIPATLGDWLLNHPIAIPILAIALIAAALYGWKQLTIKQNARGIPVRPLPAILRDITRFATREDTRPLHPKTPWATGRRTYATLTALTITAATIGIPGTPTPLIAATLTITLWARAAKIFKQRRSITNQMFAVADGECRYPKGSALRPWAFIQIQNWVNLTTPGTTVVSIPAAYQSEDMKTREKFERQFNGTVSEENAWTYKWESAKNRIVCTPAAFLPSMAPYPGPGPKWDEIPVGIGTDGQPVHIPLSVTPHVLVCGPTGSGKSVAQRSILFHALAHSDTWKIVGIDMKKVEMQWLTKYPSVLKVATDLEEAVEVLRSLRDEMMRRYTEMTENGVNHAKDLPSPPPAILCMIDESTVLLAPEGIKSDEGKERDALHAEAGMIIGELGRLSRASMIHIIACFQRPDASFLKGETKANFDCRIAAGRMDTTPSLMVLDSEAANRLPKIKGRGMIRVGGELDTFQGYFAEQGWFDQFLAAQTPPEPDTPPAVPAGTSLPSPAPGDAPAHGSAEAAAPRKRGGFMKGLAEKAAARSAAMEAESADPREGAPAGTTPQSSDAQSASPVGEEVRVPIADFDEYEDLDDDAYPSAEPTVASAEEPEPLPTAAVPRAPVAQPAGGLPSYSFGQSPRAAAPVPQVAPPTSVSVGLPTSAPRLPTRPPAP